MDVLELVDEARPDVAPIPHAARRHIRERLFNTGARPERPVAIQPEPVTPRRRRRARQVVSGFVVLLLLAGLGYALTRALDSDDTASDAASPTTVAAAESTAPPPTTAAPERATLPVRFSPLLPRAPEGYELLWARYDGSSRADNVGIARYVAPGTTAELGVVLRPDRALYTGPPPEGITTWDVDGKTVRAGGDGTCTATSCSIDVQWNPRTALSLAWTDSEQGQLPETATHESLLALLETLRPRPAAWEPGPIDPSAASWDTPSAMHAALLLPPDDERIVDARQRPGWPGTESAVFLAPDRSVIGVQEGDGPPLPLDLTDAREIGDVTVAPLEPDGTAPVYGIELACGFARVHDEDGRQPNRRLVTDLIEGMTLVRGTIGITPPRGWSLIDAGPGRDVFETQFTIGALGEDTVLTLVQSPGGSPASLMYGGRSFTPTEVDGERAWLHRSDDGSADIALVSTRGDTAYELRGSGVSPEDLSAAVGALVPETRAGWVERFGPLETADLDTTSCRRQPSLEIDAP